MSTAHDVHPRKPSAASRYLFVLLIGLVIGAVATVMLLNAWKARQDPFPDSLMNVMQWHVKQLQDNVQQNRCGATDTIPHLQSLRAMANNVEPAFPGDADDDRFKQHGSGFRATLDESIANPPLNCAGVGEVAKKIGDGCKTCHQDFRK